MQRKLWTALLGILVLFCVSASGYAELSVVEKKPQKTIVPLIKKDEVKKPFDNSNSVQKNSKVNTATNPNKQTKPSNASNEKPSNVSQTNARPNIQPVTITTPRETTRLWNLENVNIHDVIDEISRETGKNFIVDPRVTGKVSIISSTPMSSKEIYQVFLSMLELYGYAAVPSGKVIKIVPNSNAQELAAPLASRQNPGVGDELVVRVIKLANVSAERMISVIRPLMPQWANISVYSPANSLILSGPAANIKRVVEIIHRVDQTTSSGVEIIPLRYASAAKVVSVLSELENAERAQGQPINVTLAADDRSNSILLSGDSQARLRLQVLIAQLDAPTPGGFAGNTEVLYLQYQSSKTMAPILAKIAEGMASAEGGDGSGKKVSVQAETNTNSLIVSAPPAIMRALKTIVTRLDIRPAQVLINAAVVQVSETTLRKLGIEWAYNSGAASEMATTLSNLTSGKSTGSTTAFTTGQGIIRNGSLQLVVNALRRDGSANILSTPSIVVMDNKEAKMNVGSNFPITTGQYQQTGQTSTVSPFNTIGNQDIGLTLNVTPQINRGDAVILKVDQKKQTPTGESGAGGNPVTDTASFETTVMVNNGDILVLGGLLDNTFTENVDRIPLLGDIPVVGNLFKNKSHTYEKKNLMLFIQPVILYDAKQNLDVTDTKYTFMRNLQLKRRQTTIGGHPAPKELLLPPWPEQLKLPEPFQVQGLNSKLS